MRTFVTSDLHWGHRNILTFCPVTRARFQGDINYMNEAMVTEWNDSVTSEDLVYILGDVAFLPAAKATEYLRRCNGRKVLIRGNHDDKLLENSEFRNCFESIHNYLELTYKNKKIVMFHFPIYDHNGAGRGSIMLHGHRHGNPHGIPGKIKDVGMDATGQIVVELDSVIEELEKIPHMYHHDPRV